VEQVEAAVLVNMDAVVVVVLAVIVHSLVNLYR
jgi:hypothetical protein